MWLACGVERKRQQPEAAHMMYEMVLPDAGLLQLPGIASDPNVGAYAILSTGL